jgi:putative addiction module killer protein
MTLTVTAEFDAWLLRVRDRQAAMAVVGRLNRARAGNLGLWRGVGGGVAEMKIDIGQGYRVYFVQRGEQVFVLCGGNKATQAADIRRAQVLAREV